MKLELFNYDLPKELIAQFPPKVRGTTRLLVLDRKTGAIEHKKYADVPEFIKSGDVVVLNRTKVLKARIFPTVERTGKRVEILFLNEVLDEHNKPGLSDFWHCLIGRAKNVKIGDVLILGDYRIEVKERPLNSPGFVVKCHNAKNLMKEFGHVPLPPYIKRSDKPSDVIRYNTVFGIQEGSVAAPTASLNMTKDLMQKIKDAGAQICYVNLEVSWGTFAPVNTEKIEDFKIHEEWIEVPAQTAATINAAKKSGGRIWAVGTTVVRTLESAAADDEIKSFTGKTGLFIYPGYKFKVVDKMITNFHVPKSSLLMLVSAFAGRELMFSAYESAIQNKYKFLSYGDSMLIL